MNPGLARRIAITMAIFATPLIVGLLLTYQVIQVDWISFMEIQPSFRPMEAPLPVPPRSVPLQGAAYLPGTGSPVNPIQSGSDSVARGKALYGIHCALCHGEMGKGDGPLASELERKPPDLTSGNTALLSDGEVFLLVTDGLQVGAARKGGMPALRENLSVADRWDVVNYIRTLQPPGSGAAPAYRQGYCAVRALDVIGAWVAAEMPGTDTFHFTDVSGNVCQGSFPADILPLFDQPNLWYTGAPSCRTCHGPDVQISYARLNLNDYQGILAGSGRSSAEAKGDDILGGGDWEKSDLFTVLSNGEMPPNRPAEIDPQGPIILAGSSK